MAKVCLNMAANAQANVAMLPKNKSDQSKKLEAVKEIHQLKLKIQNMEREKATQLYHKHSDFNKDFSSFQEIENKMKQEIKNEESRIKQQVNKIRNMVRKFHRELIDVKPTPEFVEKLKVIMEDIETQISQFKEHQREQFEELIRDEKIVQQEINVLDNKFESWAQLGAAKVTDRKKPAPMVSSRDVTKDLPPEVAAFEKFVEQNGGPRGGWDEYDHGTFLKYRNRHKGRLTFLRELASGALPTKTEAEIRDHEKWFQEYNDLNDMKKEAIQRWKEKKELEKEEAMAKASEIDLEESQRDIEEQRRKMLEEDRQFRRVELNKWKVEKELERAQKEEFKLREKLEKTKREETEKQRKADTKKQVDLYKMKKEGELRQKELEESYQKQLEYDERKRMTTDLSKFSDRALNSAREKSRKDKDKQDKEREKAMKMSRIKSQVEAGVRRDPSRLLQPTAGWIERQKDTGASGGGQVMNMPHRAVPNWRQGIS